MSLATITWKDFSNENSVTQFNLEDPSGAAYDWAALETSLDTVGDAFEALTYCTRGKEQINAQVALGSPAIPADEEAQRELALRIFYFDTTTGKKYQMSLPGPRLDLMVSAGFDIVDWAGTEMATLETAFEANVLSPDGNAVQIITGSIVGRHN